MQAAENLLVTFHVNALQEVLNLYRRGSVYWHATGVGADRLQPSYGGGCRRPPWCDPPNRDD